MVPLYHQHTPLPSRGHLFSIENTTFALFTHGFELLDSTYPLNSLKEDVNVRRHISKEGTIHKSIPVSMSSKIAYHHSEKQYLLILSVLQV